MERMEEEVCLSLLAFLLGISVKDNGVVRMSFFACFSQRNINKRRGELGGKA
jgi:hypothetical protein